jgi:hypothetical protein
MPAILELADDETRKIAVWEKGMAIANYDPAVWRCDARGQVIKFADHGNRNSKYGWEIDHHPVPPILRVGDHFADFRPLHCARRA